MVFPTARIVAYTVLALVLVSVLGWFSFIYNRAKLVPGLRDENKALQTQVEEKDRLLAASSQAFKTAQEELKRINDEFQVLARQREAALVLERKTRDRALERADSLSRELIALRASLPAPGASCEEVNQWLIETALGSF
jgi:hypothetical protein